jgi:glutathione synthase/RimK-type ligase-like ATP-grasp enzyme
MPLINANYDTHHEYKDLRIITHNMRIAILRYENLPNFVTWEIPDPDSFFEDDRRIMAAFEAQGHEALHITWSDQSINWNEYDAAIIRTTFDYIDRPDEFIQALSRIEESSCRLYNPLAAVRWNIDKQYLLDLHQWDIPVVPTYDLVDDGLSSLEKIFNDHHWEEAIIKPRIGGGASNVRRIKSSDLQQAFQKIITTSPEQKYLIQPLISSVLTEGEWSFIFIDGTLSHTLLKKAASGDFRVQGIYGGTVEPVVPAQEDLDQVEDILSKIPFELLYARIDVIRMNGRLVVMELELIEPILYFDFAPEGVDRLVEAVMTNR